ncbi:MAG: SIMPL domain-containing protein [Terriglobales bacterium]
MRRNLSLFGVFLLPLLLAAQQTTVTVTAQGSFKAAPDTAVVSMEVAGRNAELQTAYAQAQRQAARVRALLLEQGFTPAEAHWSGFQVQPIIDYKTSHVTSYTVRNDLQLEVSNFAKIGPLLDAASGKGLSALRSVSFELKHMQSAKAAAIADGYRQAHAEAEALARAAGLPLAGLVSARVDTSGAAPLPLPRGIFMASANAAVPAPTAGFTPRRITVSAQIRAVYRLGH